MRSRRQTTVRAAITLSIAVLITSLAAIWTRAAQGPQAASTILTGGWIWTGNVAQPWAEAVAIRGDRIILVGTAEQVRGTASTSTRVIDAGGAMIVPGFIDAHTHLPMPSSVTPISLRFVKSREKFVERVAAYAGKTPKGEWILGGDWNHMQWDGELPTREWIDAVTPDNPVWLYNIDQLGGVANSAALRAAGIDEHTAGTSKGQIARDAAGKPTGFIVGNSMALIEAAAERGERDAHDRLLDDYMRRMASQGTTSVHNTTGWTQLLVFRRARSEGRLHTRIYCAMTPLSAWKRTAEFVGLEGPGDNWLRWTAVKGYAQNWPDPASNRPMLGGGASLEEFTAWATAVARLHLQIWVHDGGGIHQLLNVFERIRAGQSLTDPRFRIEHSFAVTPADAARFAPAGVIGSLQPELAFSYDDPEEFQQYLPYRLLLDSGAKIAFGSDQVIGSPLTGIALAVTHPISRGNKMTVEEALRAYTADAAYAEFMEKEKGTIEPGKLADLVMLDHDLTKIPPGEIRNTKVLMTMVGGRIVYQRETPPGK
jgi:predicted amidohydrolase YtcJ